MAEDIRRGWLDIAERLLIPVVIFAGGILYTAHKDWTDGQRAEANRKADVARQELQRDTGYVKLLAVRDLMRNLGFDASVQDFTSSTPVPLHQIEVWIGKSQDALTASK